LVKADVVRHVGRLHEIGEADRGAVTARLACDQIYHALDDEHGLRLAGAAIRCDGTRCV